MKREKVILASVVVMGVSLAVLIGCTFIPGFTETIAFEVIGYATIHVFLWTSMIALVAWLYPYAFFLFCDVVEEHAKTEKARQTWHARADRWYDKIVTEQL